MIDFFFFNFINKYIRSWAFSYNKILIMAQLKLKQQVENSFPLTNRCEKYIQGQKKPKNIKRLKSLEQSFLIRPQNEAQFKKFYPLKDVQRSYNQNSTDEINFINHNTLPVTCSLFVGHDYSLNASRSSPRFNSTTSSSQYTANKKKKSKFIEYRLKSILNYVDILHGRLAELVKEIQQLQMENKRNIQSFGLIIQEYQSLYVKALREKLYVQGENQKLIKEFEISDKKIKERIKIECNKKFEEIITENKYLERKKDRKFSQNHFGLKKIYSSDQKRYDINPYYPKKQKSDKWDLIKEEVKEKNIKNFSDEMEMIKVRLAILKKNLQQSRFKQSTMNPQAPRN